MLQRSRSLFIRRFDVMNFHGFNIDSKLRVATEKAKGTERI